MTDPANSPNAAASPEPPAEQLERAKKSLQQTLWRYRRQENPELKKALEGDLNTIEALLRKLDRFVVRIAVFGMVSRGKSAVLNGLMGNEVLETGPLNGVTRVARALEWVLDGEKRSLRVELVDTPGLDEIEGEGRAAIAWDVADGADLILFVVAGDITQVEFQALRELRAIHKPLILVFNKIDLYPEAEHGVIIDRLKALMHLEEADGGDRPEKPQEETQEALETLDNVESPEDLSNWQPVLPVDEVVLVAAEPSPVKVREEWPDGRINYIWESPPPNVDNLQSSIRTIVEREGELLLAFNALFQARLKEQAIAKKTTTHLETGAENNGWKIIQIKAVLVTLSPVIGLDLIGGFVADLWSVKQLATLYGLPLTNYGAQDLWRSLAISSGTLAIAEILSVVTISDQSFSVSLGLALLQGFCAAWGSQKVNKAARSHLEKGCTWTDTGSDTVARGLLDTAEEGTLLYRWRSQLMARINQSTPNPSENTEKSDPP